MVTDTRTRTLGVALSASELCVVRRAAAGQHAGVWRIPLQPLNGDGIGWPALTAALNEVSRALSVNGGRLDVALMPPLTELRRLDLPLMGENELRMLLSRNAAKYFVGARAQQLVGTVMAPQTGAGAAGGVMAAAVPLRLVAALHTAAREAGWTVEAVSPAEGAWCAAAAAMWPATSKSSSHLLVCGDDTTELLQLDQGRLSAVRKFRAGADDAALVADAIAPAGAAVNAASGRVLAIGASGQRNALARALSSGGISVSAPPPEWSDRADFADLLAAEFAGPKAAPLLRSDATLATRRQIARRAIAKAITAAAVMLLLASVFSFWGAKRQLAAVRAGRAAIKPQISVTLVGRTSVEMVYRQLAALAAAQRSGTNWSGIVGDMSTRLADQSYLTSFRARGDSLLLEGIAVNARKAFDSISQMPSLTNVRAAAPVRREVPSGGPAVERFTVGAIVAHPGSVNVPSPATSARKASP